ncbi:MAG: DUF4154 domain-containing protein [Pseudomonadales bacterium]|nr:DUF4154 domain-containing protein [Pseudomonadales bacterium]
MVEAKPAQLEMSEAKAKSALLYNFIKHSRWPDESNQKVIKVAFLVGDNTFFKTFKPVAAQALIRNKAIKLRLISDYKLARDVQVLVIPEHYNTNLDAISSFMSLSQTLLITDNAKNSSAVMINYTHPKAKHISFEVNRSNIVYEKLGISKDIRLYGGSEIEVAQLYKEMEKRLIKSKALLAVQTQKLQNQQAILDQQTLKINDKNQYIDAQKTDIGSLHQEQSEIKNLLDYSAQQLYLSQTRVDGVQKRLVESRKVSVQLADKINNNAEILTQQKVQIHTQEKRIGAQSEKLDQQENTISSQRGIIYIALCALLLITLYIIFKQKLALGKERAISVKKTETVKIQEASIDAYKSSIQVKNDFLTAINHELRTPMHLIMGALQGISSDDKDSLQHSLGIVEDGAEQMMLLISDILFYSELQSEQLQINPSSVDIKYQLLEACELHRPDAQDKGLGFFIHFSHAVPEYLNLDVERLCIIIEKLVDNAVKYTLKGEVVIHVDWKVSDGPQLLIHINDSGVGFSDEALARAFLPFDQADNGLSRVHGGLGIGLSISEKLINMMLGGIRIESDQQRGTSIHLNIPAPKAHQDKFSSAAAAKLNNPGPSNPTNQPVKLQKVSPLRLAVDNTKTDTQILIVEDNPVSQLVITKIIKSLGYQCLLANDGSEALEVLRDKEPDLVLMDIQMPNMSGIECTRQHRQSKNTYQPPIIALTANPVEAIRQECLQVGMEAVLSKPIDIQLLESHIKRLLSDRKTKSMEV